MMLLKHADFTRRIHSDCEYIVNQILILEAYHAFLYNGGAADQHSPHAHADLV